MVIHGSQVISIYRLENPTKDVSSMTHLSPGISSKLVKPVQLMSSRWERERQNVQEAREINSMEGKGAYIGMWNIDGNVRTSRGESWGTHRPLDEKHADCPGYWHISDQRLQNYPHHPMKLETEKDGTFVRTVDWRLSDGQKPSCLNTPVFLWLQLCRSTSSPPRWSPRCQHSCMKVEENGKKQWYRDGFTSKSS